ncbi:hypothetical protein HQ590_13525, partial [bacterium]|nr:hypothetical protein [bacterium]
MTRSVCRSRFPGRAIRRWWGPLTAALILAVGAPVSSAAVKANQVPLFEVKCRIVSAGGGAPTGRVFSVKLGEGTPVSVTGDVWSTALVFDKAQAEHAVKNYPNSYARSWPVLTSLNIQGVIDPTVVEGELTINETGQKVALHAELTGPRLALLVWREDDNSPHAATATEYNRRYWKHLASVNVPPERRPKLIPIVDRYIGADDDRLGWQEGMTELNKAGFSALMVPPSAQIRKYWQAAGASRVAWAIYNPPGYAFDYGTNLTETAIEQWAQGLADEYTKAGFALTNMAVYTISDEPGWYYPSMFEALQKSDHGMTRFRQYLKDQGLKPRDLGIKSWEDARPLGRNQAKDLPSRRLFYWTMRFFSWDSSRHFSVATRAMEKAFYPGLLVLVNFNNFSSRSYIPGPVANNGAKTDPNAAMGGHDWLEFGRVRGVTAISTEDWFGDEQAAQWSFYASKLRCAAAKSGVQFGALIIPRTAGARPDGILQKLLTHIGSGAKVVKYFVFGPEYVFPGNCYSFKAELLPKMAEAHGMIGAAEEVLWPGKRPAGEVAIVMPRSSQMWDAKETAIPTMIQDMTNARPWTRTVDYLAELFGLYTALQHANVTVDFLEEEDLGHPATLARYKVIYVTGPNLPLELHAPLKAWVTKGGTLATVQNAATADRYDDPADLLAR